MQKKITKKVEQNKKPSAVLKGHKKTAGKTRWKKITKLAVVSFGVIAFGLGILSARSYGIKIAMQKGNHSFNQDVYDLTQAEKWYKIATRLAPNSDLSHYQLGRVYFVENKLDSAISEFDTTLRVNPDNKRTYYMRGLAKGYKEDYVGSQADFKTFVDNFPKEWAGYNDLAWAYYQDKQYDKARDAAEKGVELFPENAWLLNGLGVAYIGLGEKDKAQEILEKAATSAEGLMAKDWKLAYPGNDPTSADVDLAIFKNNIQENIFSSKSVLAMDTPKFASACNSSPIKMCSGGQCLAIGTVCDHDPVYHCLVWGTGSCITDPFPDSVLCSSSGLADQCSTNADCCVPSCAGQENYCSWETISNGCGGTCPGTLAAPDCSGQSSICAGLVYASNRCGTCTGTKNCTPTVGITVAPNPVPYGGKPLFTLSSTLADYCQVIIDLGVSNIYIVNGYTTSGVFDNGNFTSTGPHTVSAICYNSLLGWIDSGMVTVNFTVDPAAQCGNANKTIPYPPGQLAWLGETFCDYGNPAPNSPPFPPVTHNPGQTSTSWKCVNPYDGTNVDCQVKRDCVPDLAINPVCYEIDPSYCTNPANIKTTCGTESPKGCLDSCNRPTACVPACPVKICGSCSQGDWKEVAPSS